MGDVIRLISKSELERIRLIREARAIYDSIFPPLMRSESGQMVASAEGHNRAERARFLEKKRSDDRSDFVRKFLHEKTVAPGQPLDLNIWQSCRGLDFGARARRRLIAAVRATTGRSHKDAIDSERPSTVSKLIKLMRRTYHRTIHLPWRSLAFLIVSALRTHLLNLPPGDACSHADFSQATFSNRSRRRLAFILQSTNRARSRQSDCPR
jgi:hypothetical protein